MIYLSKINLLLLSTMVTFLVFFLFSTLSLGDRFFNQEKILSGKGVQLYLNPAKSH